MLVVDKGRRRPGSPSPFTQETLSPQNTQNAHFETKPGRCDVVWQDLSDSTVFDGISLKTTVTVENKISV